MNPWWITACGLGQLVLLQTLSPWTAGLAVGAGLLVILGVFAFTRLRWDAHLDMILSMAGPGGFGMMLAQGRTPACHLDTLSLLTMTAGMLVFSLPSCWMEARCVLDARARGRGLAVLLADVVGMQAGMMLGHLPASLVNPGDPRLAWVHHGSMLAGMLLGMTAAMVATAYFRREETA